MASSECSAGARAPGIVTARAPMRFDLAGGWTDVPPFSADEGGAVFNVAIQRYATVRVARRGDERVCLRSDDYHARVEADDIASLIYDGTLDLLKAAVRVAGVSGIDLSVSSDTPPGAGLGASASVGVALLGALNALRVDEWPRHELADRAHRLEVDEIGVAGGRQDQYAALNGGFQYLEFADPAAVGTPVELTDAVTAALTRDLVLCYTGRSRISGGIISTVMGNYKRGDPRTTGALHRLKAIASEMRDALIAGDLQGFGALLLDNWRCQKDLDASVTTPEIDSLFDFAQGKGAKGGKALGAGGGGCILFYAPASADALREGLTERGLAVLEFAFDVAGLQVRAEAV
ncbi:MAG: GHMP kinase [Anaerolineae bacterium]